MDVDAEYQESTTITFEWTLRGLKSLFESTKGDSKSKVTKSARFGGGRWQILFYANAGTAKEGTPDGGFVSLYLSCEPTTEEKESALADGKWVREGVYKFSFELRNVGKTVLYNLKEAHNHSFSHKTANWGWAQFARRDNVYFQSNPVKVQDAFVIMCTITSSPSTPHPPPILPRQSVPKGLLDTVGALLDDPTYSDVEFILPRRGRNMKNARKIWASRRLLNRADYFESMFGSGFAEGSMDGLSLAAVNRSSSTGRPDSAFLANHFEDSDDEDDDISEGSHSDSEVDPPSSVPESLASTPGDDPPEESIEEDHRNVRPKLIHPSSPRNTFRALSAPNSVPDITGPKKLTVVVRDVAYSTYRAILYYIYTDTIVFAPLSSSFSTPKSDPPATPITALSVQAPPSTQGNVAINSRSTQHVDTANTRKDWIAQWQKNNPERPAPCSAKAAYRLADRLDLRELKERASQHIFKSLSVENIAYEVFSPFAAAFDEIRKVQVSFFLENWASIRGSESMRNVWQQIRNGRHPGFEEVWPVIALSLEFKPPVSSTAAAGGDVRGD